MRDDYLQNAQKVIGDPNILVNVVSHRVKQLRRGSRALIESLEKLSPEDIALREIAEGKITFELGVPEPESPVVVRPMTRNTTPVPKPPKADPAHAALSA